MSLIERSEADDGEDPTDPAEALAAFRADVDALIRRAQALGGPDPKLDALRQVIRDKQVQPDRELPMPPAKQPVAHLVAVLGTVVPCCSCPA